MHRKLRKLASLPSELKRLDAVAEHYRVPYWKVAARVAGLCRRYAFTPLEVVYHDLADPSVPLDEHEGCLGKRGKYRLQRLLCPVRWEALGEDKAVFNAYCTGQGLPVARSHGVLRRDVGWTSSGSVSSRDGWVRYFADEAPEEFVIKPTRGHSGEAVHVYRRVGGGFDAHDGITLTASEVADRALMAPGYGAFVIEDRLAGHPDLVALSGTPFLQTIRIETVVRRDGGIELHTPRIRLIAGDDAIDNLAGGSTGNMVAVLSMDEGRIGAVYVPDPNGLPPGRPTHHPRTGRGILDFTVPCWTEVKELALRAAAKFLPIRAIGWDIAVTPTGPVLVEANPFADPLHNFPAPSGWAKQRDIVPALRAAAGLSPRES